MPPAIRQHSAEDGQQLAMAVRHKRVALQRMREDEQPQKRRRMAEDRSVPPPFGLGALLQPRLHTRIRSHVTAAESSESCAATINGNGPLHQECLPSLCARLLLGLHACYTLASGIDYSRRATSGLADLQRGKLVLCDFARLLSDFGRIDREKGDDFRLQQFEPLLERRQRALRPLFVLRLDFGDLRIQFLSRRYS